MIRPGLCSVTFRELDVPGVIRHAARSGLACIEWAGDVHVPPGDQAAAEEARALTEDAGLEVASYGSYLRFDGEHDQHVHTAREVVLAAHILGAPRVRVWAGRRGSAEASAQERANTTRRIREFADQAAERDLSVGIEFHRGTLTDTSSSTVQLLEEVDRASVTTYWQPPVGADLDSALESLRQVLPKTSTIHAFSWWPSTQRLPLAERADLWSEVIGILAREGSARDVLLEFVPDDSPELLPREADTLNQLIADATDDLATDH